MSYGYDSRVTNWWEMVSQNSVGDHANNLLRDLANHREEDDTVMILRLPSKIIC